MKEQKKEIKAILPLAQRYRPKTLDDVVGHDVIVQKIRGMFKSRKIPNAILLTGGTGMGKTTLGRIIGSMLLSDDPANFNISSSPDFHEMNAADARGIDDVRNLIRQVQFKPTSGKFRIFLIDECFPADTMLCVNEGKHVSIKDIVQDDSITHVLSYNYDTKSVELKPILNKWERPKAGKRMVKVTLADGSTQICTDDHKWWSVTRNQMVMAKDLQQGESLLTYVGENDAQT